MARDLEAQLRRIDDGDITFKLVKGVLSVAMSEANIGPYDGLDSVAAAMGATEVEGVVEAARAAAGEPAPQRALWIADAMDTGNNVLTVYTGIRTALELYRARRAARLAGSSAATATDVEAARESEAEPAPIPIDHRQAEDVVLKALGLGYLIGRIFPGTPREQAAAFVSIPAGRALVGWFASVEVALPFMDDAIHSDSNVIDELFESVGQAEHERLGTIAGEVAVAEAEQVWLALKPAIDHFVTLEAGRVRRLAHIAERFLGALVGMAERAGTVFAHGADVLPVYRFLCARAVAEAVIVEAAIGLGYERVIPTDEETTLLRRLVLGDPTVEPEAGEAAPEAVDADEAEGHSALPESAENDALGFVPFAGSLTMVGLGGEHDSIDVDPDEPATMATYLQPDPVEDDDEPDSHDPATLAQFAIADPVGGSQAAESVEDAVTFDDVLGPDPAEDGADGVAMVGELPPWLTVGAEGVADPGASENRPPPVPEPPPPPPAEEPPPPAEEPPPPAEESPPPAEEPPPLPAEELESESEPAPRQTAIAPKPKPKRRGCFGLFALTVLLFGVPLLGGAAVGVWYVLDPAGVQRLLNDAQQGLGLNKPAPTKKQPPRPERPKFPGR